MDIYIEKLRVLIAISGGNIVHVPLETCKGIINAYNTLQRRVDDLEEERRQAELDAWGDNFDIGL